MQRFDSVDWRQNAVRLHRVDIDGGIKNRKETGPLSNEGKLCCSDKMRHFWLFSQSVVYM